MSQLLNSEELIESLVMRGADVDGNDSSGRTALHRAAFTLQSKCVRRQVTANIQTSVNLKELHTCLLITAVTFSDSPHICSTDFTKENTHKCTYANEQKLCVDDNVTRPTRFL